MGKFIAPAMTRVAFTKLQLRELIAALDKAEHADGSVIAGVLAKVVTAHDNMK